MAKRGNRGQFKPGRSGNPGGRPKGLAEFRLAARRYSKDALGVLASIMRDKKAAASARVHAASELFDRAWGKSAQEITVEGAMAPVDVTHRGDDSAEARFNTARRIVFLLKRTDEQPSVAKQKAPKAAKKKLKLP